MQKPSKNHWKNENKLNCTRIAEPFRFNINERPLLKIAYKYTTSRMYHPSFKFKNSITAHNSYNSSSECTVKLGDKELFGHRTSANLFTIIQVNWHIGHGNNFSIIYPVVPSLALP